MADFETEHALRLWREGEATATGYAATHQAEAYARAITVVLANLQPFTTLSALVASWYDKRAGAALDVVSHTTSGRALHLGVVEDAAYWRRWQHLMQEDTIPTVRIIRVR
jgi:hypothetical protein